MRFSVSSGSLCLFSRLQTWDHNLFSKWWSSVGEFEDDFDSIKLAVKCSLTATLDIWMTPDQLFPCSKSTVSLGDNVLRIFYFPWENSSSTAWCRSEFSSYQPKEKQVFGGSFLVLLTGKLELHFSHRTIICPYFSLKSWNQKILQWIHYQNSAQINKSAHHLISTGNCSTFHVRYQICTWTFS